MSSLRGLIRRRGVNESEPDHPMLDTPQIIQTTPQHTASIHLTIPREQIREVMGPGLSEVRGALQAQGIPAAGPWLTYHRRMAPETFDFEICIPVGKPATP